MSIIASRIPPAVQSRLRCANAPPTRPIPSASAIGACIEPGPFSLKARTAGNATNKMKNTIITMGANIPSCPDWGYARLNEKFLLRNTTPIAIPMMNPTRPNTAFKSPAPKRKNIRSGHPKNINAPIITKKPNTKRVKGAEPPRGLNSFFMNAIANAPAISPMTSGRIYCTTAALCNFNEPAMSRKKQAIQKPIFPGFPNLTNTTAAIPINAPVNATMKCFFIPFLRF